MANLYLFYGSEDYLIDQRIKQFKAQNIERLDGKSASKEQILETLQGQSLFAQEKLVIIDSIDFREEKWNEIVPSLKNLSSQTTLVIVAKTAPARSKLVKFIKEKGEVLEFKTFADCEEDQVIRWIENQVKKQGKKIERQAAATLQEVCGKELRKLCSEIDKLITFIGAKDKIETEDVLTLASPGETSVFALLDALTDKNAKNTLSNFINIYKNKADVFRMLGLLAHQYRIMLFVKSTPVNQRNPFNIAKQIGVSPYFVKKCSQKINKFSEAELQKALELILETDLKLKSGQSQAASLELLLTSLCAK